jgi:hypothetical protein
VRGRPGVKTGVLEETDELSAKRSSVTLFTRAKKEKREFTR